MFLGEPDDGHNRPKLVARISKIERYKQSWLWLIFFVKIEYIAVDILSSNFKGE
jgi:hypothetical protein